MSKRSVYLDPATLLGEAQGLAKDAGMKSLSRHIREQPEVEFVGTRGRSEGPGRSVSSVLPGRTDVYMLNFRGSQPAVIEVVGGGTTDLDCYLYDQNGSMEIER